MAAITFHFNVGDPVGYACRLLRKAHAQGLRCRVTAQPAELEQLNAALWTFSALEFVPHAYSTSVQASRSAVVLVPDGELGDADFSQGLWLHWGELAMDAAPWASAHARCVELVRPDAAQRADARQRYKQYVALGHSLSTHDATA